VAGGVAAALVLGAVAGLYPAVRAARLAPTDALRTT
jgi:putative ABC transport system permease protein